MKCQQQAQQPRLTVKMYNISFVTQNSISVAEAYRLSRVFEALPPSTKELLVQDIEIKACEIMFRVVFDLCFNCMITFILTLSDHQPLMNSCFAN